MNRSFLSRYFDFSRSNDIIDFVSLLEYNATNLYFVRNFSDFVSVCKGEETYRVDRIGCTCKGYRARQSCKHYDFFVKNDIDLCDFLAKGRTNPKDLLDISDFLGIIDKSATEIDVQDSLFLSFHSKLTPEVREYLTFPGVKEVTLNLDACFKPYASLLFNIPNASSTTCFCISGKYF